MKKRFLFRKCLLAIGMVFSILPISSCSAFFGGDEYAIVDTNIETDDNGNTIVTINFSGENTEPLTFSIPPSSKGISSIEAVSDEKQVVLTITFTDGTSQQIGIPIINGEDGVGISSVGLIQNDEGESFIQFTYTNGEKSEEFPLPKGNDGAGILSVTSTTQNGVTTYTMSFTDGRDDVVFSVRDGISISNMYLDEESSANDENYYHFIVEFSDGRKQEILVERPQTNHWLSGVGAPSSDLGNPEDFYVDLTSGWVYTKSSDRGWEARFSIKGEGQEDPQRYMVSFNLLEGEKIENANLEGPTSFYFSVKEGDSLPASEIPIPSKDGFTFDGWYQEPGNPNSGKFTDLSIINSNLTLYANWILN